MKGVSKYSLIILMLLISIIPPQINAGTRIAWYHTWGSWGDDYAVAACKDNYGNIYVVGFTAWLGPGNFYNIFVAKFSSKGVLIWDRAFGTPYGREYAKDVTIDSDGNLYIIGYEETPYATYPFIVKVSKDGNLLWGYEVDSSAFIFNSITADQNGNIYVIGNYFDAYSSTQDILIVKFDRDGTLISAWKYGSRSANEYGIDICIGKEGNIYIAGVTDENQNFDVLIAKLDDQGSLIWCKRWGGLEDDYVRCISLDISRKYQYIYIAGYTESVSLSKDVFIAKFDCDGNLLWSKVWYGPSDEDVSSNGLVAFKRGIYITGSTDSYGAGQTDTFLIMFSKRGRLIKALTFGWTSADEGNTIIIGKRYIVCVGAKVYFNYEIKRFKATIITPQFAVSSEYPSNGGVSVPIRSISMLSEDPDAYIDYPLASDAYVFMCRGRFP